MTQAIKAMERFYKEDMTGVIEAAAKNKVAKRIIFDTGILSSNASVLLTSGDYKRYMEFRKEVKESGIDLKQNLSAFGRAVFSAPHLLYRLASIIKRKQNHLTPLWVKQSSL